MGKIDIDDNGELWLSGELTFATTPHLHKLGCHLIMARALTVFNLKNVTVSDNSGTALLAAWTRYAKILKKQVKFTHLPAQLLAMLRLTSLQKLLPIENPS